MKKVLIILIAVLFALVGCDSLKNFDAGIELDNSSVSTKQIVETLKSNQSNEALSGYFLDFEIDKKISNKLEEIDLKLFVGHLVELENYWIDEVSNDELSFSILLFSNANMANAANWYMEKDLVTLTLLEGFDYPASSYNARLGGEKIEYDFSNIFSLAKKDFITSNQGQIIIQIVATRGSESIDLAQREFYFSINDNDILFSLTDPTPKLNNSDGWTQEEISLQISVLGFSLPFPSNTIFHYVVKYEFADSYYIEVDFRFDSEKLLEEGRPSFYCLILEAEGYTQIYQDTRINVYQKNINGKIVEVQVVPFSGLFGYMVVATIK